MTHLKLAYETYFRIVEIFSHCYVPFVFLKHRISFVLSDGVLTVICHIIFDLLNGFFYKFSGSPSMMVSCMHKICLHAIFICTYAMSSTAVRLIQALCCIKNWPLHRLSCILPL